MGRIRSIRVVRRPTWEFGLAHHPWVFSFGVVGEWPDARDFTGHSSDLCPTLVLADSPTPRASGSWWPAGPSTVWGRCSSRVTGRSPLPTPSGISLWHLVLVPTTMPSGGTSIFPAPCRPRCPNEVAQTARTFGLLEQSIMGSVSANFSPEHSAQACLPSHR